MASSAILTLDSGDSVAIGQNVSVQITGNTRQKFRVYVQAPKGFSVTQKKKSGAVRQNREESGTQNQLSVLAEDIIAHLAQTEDSGDWSRTKAQVNELVLQILNRVLLEDQRQHRRQKQLKAVAVKRENGEQIGRKKKAMPDAFQEVAESWLCGKISASQAARDLGISYQTFTRRAKELEAESLEGSEEGRAVEIEGEQDWRREDDSARHHQSAALSYAGTGSTV